VQAATSSVVILLWLQLPCCGKATGSAPSPLPWVTAARGEGAHGWRRLAPVMGWAMVSYVSSRISATAALGAGRITLRFLPFLRPSGSRYANSSPDAGAPMIAQVVVQVCADG